MSWILSKNCIIEGPVASFCLVCECIIKNVDEIDKHIEDRDHGNRLCLYPYLEKYYQDRIRKIKAVYLCEFCNIILKTATKVNAHICTREHLNNRGLQQLRAGVNNGVIAFNEVLINEDAWHANYDNCCSLCDEEECDSKHKKSLKHLLKLVQSKIEFVENGLYRQIDEDTVQCLTCNIIFDINSINNHFDSEDHKITFNKSKTKEDNSIVEIKTDNSNADIVYSKSNAEKAVDQKDVVPEDDEIEILSKDNEIAYIVGNDSAYCRVCDTRISSTFRSMKEHVVEVKHINQLKSKKPKLVTTPQTGFFYKTIVLKTNVSQEAVINYKLCISFWSLFMVFKVSENVLQCHVCEEKIDEECSPSEHIIFPKHTKAIKACKVVTTYADEFLREIRPDIFHCGFCNIVVPKWDDVPKHLESADHKVHKVIWQFKLHHYLPGLLIDGGFACKVDENKIQCLICNILLDIDSVNNHFDSEDHKAAITKSQGKEDNANDDVKTKKSNGDNLTPSNSNTGKEKKGGKDDMSEINEINKICKDNKIKYNSGYDSAHCRVCDVRLPPTLRSLKEHIVGIKHVNKLKSNKKKLVTKPIKQFVKEQITFKGQFCHDMLINSKICIPMTSYFMITENSECWKCHVCKQNLREDFLQEHLRLLPHKKAVEGALVVTSFDSEFLREIRPGVFHCGFCNILVSKWDDVPKHLESADHKFEKGASQYRLSEYLKKFRQN